MIQRKQSLWLLIAALLNAGILFTTLYSWHETTNGIDTLHELKVSNNYPLLIVTVVLILVPAAAIFMFGNRKRQMALCFTGILSCISFMGIMQGKIHNETSKAVSAISNASYSIGAILPVLAIFFFILAIFGIRKDDKLVRSMDRLR